MKSKVLYFSLSLLLIYSNLGLSQSKATLEQKSSELVEFNNYSPRFKKAIKHQDNQTQNKQSGASAISSLTLTDIPLGCSKDIWSGFRTPGMPRLDFSPVGQAGILTMVHPSGLNCVPSDNKPAGSIMVDISKDGGITWNAAPSLGPMGNFSTNWAKTCGGLIYNPPGNTIPDSAYISYVGFGGNSTPWNLNHTGAARVYNPNVYKQTVSVFGTNLNFIGYYPEAFVEDGLGNHYYVCKALGTINGNYNDTIIVRKGVWNVSQKKHVYSTGKIAFPVFNDTLWFGKMISHLNVAANGQTVYVSAIACADLLFSPDTLNYLTVWKSIDGGVSWSAPYKISVDLNAQLATVGEKYTCGNTNDGYDGAVDSLGNYHMILPISAYPSWISYAFSIKTNGSSNTKTLLNRLQTTEGLYGSPIATTDGNRAQIAMSPNRDMVFYVWFDTDTAKWNTMYNNYPDAHSRTYHVATQTFDTLINLTEGTIVDGKMTVGFVANWVGSGNGCNSGPYKLHMGYMEATGTANNPFIYHYVGAYCQPNYTGISETTISKNEILNIFPNPTSGLINIELNFEKTETTSLIVSNALGQTIHYSKQALESGKQVISIDATKWSSGVYFVSLKAENFCYSKKLVKE